MAAITNTYQTYQQIGLRESLHDIIYDISPEETPFLSAAGRGEAEATTEEWQTDVLAAPDTGNAHIEGDDITSFPAQVPTARVGNHTQISRKLILIADTAERVRKAGRRGEMAYQLPRRGIELRKDIEAMIFENIAGNAGAAGTARRSAGLATWVVSNDNREAGGADSGHTTGVPTSTATDSGTLRAFTETILKDVVEQMWISGANIRSLFVGPHNKQVVSGFTGVVTRNFDMSNVDPSPTAVIAAVDVYVTDFGTLKIMPSRWQRERDAWFLDFEFLNVLFLRPFQTVRLAKTGDAEKRMLIAEWTLQVKNEAALGVAADLETA